MTDINKDTIGTNKGIEEKNSDINSSTSSKFTEIEDIDEIFLVVPAYNEEKTVGAIIEEIASKGYNIILVDDGSSDGTYEIAKESKRKYPDNIFIYQHVINKGLGAALKTGMVAALDHGAKYVVTFDADGQHDIGDIAKVSKPLKEEDIDFVIGSRPFEDMPRSKNFANTVMNLLTRIFYKMNVKDSQSGLRAFKAEIIPELNIISEGYGVSSEFIREIRRNHLKLEEVEITTIYTPETQAKGTNAIVGLKILIKMIIDILK